MGAEVELGGIPRDIPKDLRVWGNAGICPHGKSSSLEKLELGFPSCQAPAQLGREGEPGFLWESCCGVLPVLPLISVTLSLLYPYIIDDIHKFSLWIERQQGRAGPELRPAGDSGVSWPFP